ncbi:MAG: hypothetical protein LBR88_06395 [Zoogloeaceae bacterium]|jgi:hypothetical protein|nr:hypothetical protein [Zoogloeaceae bacterium]
MKRVFALLLTLLLFTNSAQAEIGRLFLTPRERLAPAAPQAEPDPPAVAPEADAPESVDTEAPQASGWIRQEASGKTLRWRDGALREDSAP